MLTFSSCVESAAESELELQARKAIDLKWYSDAWYSDLPAGSRLDQKVVTLVKDCRVRGAETRNKLLVVACCLEGSRGSRNAVCLRQHFLATM